MPMSKKVFKLKTKASLVLHLNLELLDKCESLLAALKRAGITDSSVVYHYAQLRDFVKEMEKAREELSKLM
jgi:predicted urease superfamily metal-dependent hydrolase